MRTSGASPAEHQAGQGDRDARSAQAGGQQEGTERGQDRENANGHWAAPRDARGSSAEQRSPQREGSHRCLKGGPALSSAGDAALGEWAAIMPGKSVLLPVPRAPEKHHRVGGAHLRANGQISSSKWQQRRRLSGMFTATQPGPMGRQPSSTAAAAIVALDRLVDHR